MGLKKQSDCVGLSGLLNKIFFQLKRLTILDNILFNYSVTKTFYITSDYNSFFEL